MESEAKLAHAGDTEDAGGADESYPGHASLHLMTDFLAAVSSNRFDDGLYLAQKILKFEPGNSLVRGYQPVLLQMKKMREEEKMAEMGSDDEDDSDEDEEGDSDSDGDEDEESEEDGGEEGSAAEGGDVAAAEEAKGSDAAEFKSDRQTARTGGGFR